MYWLYERLLAYENRYWQYKASIEKGEYVI